MTEKASELDERTHEAIKLYCSEGDRLFSIDKFDDAITSYNEAWKLIPDPKYNWNASTWILMAVADADYFAGYNTSAREALEYALHCPGGFGNPFVHLRLGEVLLNMDDLDGATEHLLRAYALEGAKVFQNEDPKYLAFLKTRAII